MGPKKPVVHVSQEEPENPGAHLHVPDAEQTPDAAHGGEHAVDWMSTRDSEVGRRPTGSSSILGIESQRTRRSFGNPSVTVIHMFAERLSDLAASGVDEFTVALAGRAENPDCPE